MSGSNKIKALFVIPNMGSGGAERVVSILSNQFVNSGHPVGIIYFLDRTSDYVLSDSVERIYFCDTAEKKTGTLSRIKEFRKLILGLSESCVPVLIPFHDTCLKYCVMSTALTRIPVIACERNNPFIKGNSALSKFKSGIAYRLSDMCVFQTDGAKQYYPASVKNKSRVINNPLDLSFIGNWRGTDSKKIISVGRLEAQKNQALLIDAFSDVVKSFPEYILDIYGEGSLREKLQDQIDILGLTGKVNLCGLTDKIGEVMSESRLFVLSSDYEGMSNALIEAMAAGVPVISTDHPCGGARALINSGENGVLVPVGDRAALTSAIKGSLLDPSGDERKAKEALKIRDKLSAEATAEKWLEVIEIAAGTFKKKS